MASQVLTDCKLWLSGYDLSGDMNALAATVSAAMLDDTRFGNSTKINRGGLKSVAVNHQGYWNGGDSGVDATLFGRIGLADVPMSISPQAGAVGDTAFTFRSVLSTYAPGAQHGELLGFSVTGEGSDGAPLARGRVLFNGTATTTGTGTGVLVAAVPADQSLYAALHVTSASGTTPTLSVVVESDTTSGFGSPVTVATFAEMTAIGSDWQVAAGANADTYYRISYTIGGTAPSFGFVVVVGIA